MNGQSTVGAFFADRDIADTATRADECVPPTRIAPLSAKRARERGCPVRCARSLRESAPTASLHIVRQSTVGAFSADRDIADTATRADECAPPTRIAPLPAKRARERGCPVRCARSLRESAPTASLHIVGQSTVGAFFAGRDIADICARSTSRSRIGGCATAAVAWARSGCRWRAWPSVTAIPACGSTNTPRGRTRARR